MPQQWDFWGFPVIIRGQTGQYWGTLPDTFEIRFPPTNTWAFTMLQTIRVWDEHDGGTAFAQLSFTGYDYIDNDWVSRSNDVSKPDNTWNKTAYIWDYGMTAVRVESLNRNVSARGFVKLEFWSEPWKRFSIDDDWGPRSFEAPSFGSGAPAGPASRIADFRVVALHDDDHGEIVSQHSFVSLAGGSVQSAEAAVASALDIADRQHHAALNNPAEQAFRARHRLELLPVKKLRATISTEPALLGAATRLDKGGKGLVAADDEERRVASASRESS